MTDGAGNRRLDSSGRAKMGMGQSYGDRMTNDKNPKDLSGISLFADLAPEAIRDIANAATWHQVAAGDTVFDQETDALEVYCVVSGSVRILTIVGEREVTLAEIPGGNVFGEIAAIDGQPRSAKAVASTDSLLASIDGPKFTKMLLKYPTIALKII
jgi:CRP-like cAMP-binding protein